MAQDTALSDNKRLTDMVSHGSTRIGVLLLNLGTPDAPTPQALRRYLKEFLSDQRVIELPRWLWWPLLHGVILTLRPYQSARKYASIWRKQGSPLLVETQAQTEALRAKLTERGLTNIVLAYAMRYGNPSIASTLADLQAQHIDRLLVVPLYPQYSAAATASALDGVFTELMRMRHMPALRTLNHFYDHPAYIDALARSISANWQAQGRPEVLVMSFHGMPAFTRTRGDPYFDQCQQSARLLAKALQLAPSAWRISFQSRFGRAKWLEPYTIDVVGELAKSGIQRVDVVCPGFVVDCLETLEEIAIEVRAEFERHGGQHYHYLPCLNSHPDWINALVQIMTPHLSAWNINVPPDDAEGQSQTLNTERHLEKT